MSKFEMSTPQIPSVDKQREALDGMSAHLRDRLEEMQRLQERKALSMKDNKVRAEAALREELPAAKVVQPVAVPVQEIASVVEDMPPLPPRPVAASPDVPREVKAALPPVKNPPPAQFAALVSKPKTELPPVKDAVTPPPSYGQNRGGLMPRPPLAKPNDQKDEMKASPFIVAFFILVILIYMLSK